MKVTDGVVAKYVYGRGLIGEEVNNAFKTYHFDFIGGTISYGRQWRRFLGQMVVLNVVIPSMSTLRFWFLKIQI